MERLSNTATIFDFGNTKVLVSYETKVALFDPSTKTVFKTSKKWSNTTSKQIKQFVDHVGASVVEVKDQSFFDGLTIVF
jgi:outer membrane lipoprotein-sorting protein